MAQFAWLDGSASTVISTGLDSLANSALAASNAIDNDAELDFYADFELYVDGFGSSINQGQKVAELYVVPTLDGTNYPDGHDASVQPQAVFNVGNFEKRTANGTTAVRMIVSGVILPPRDYKAVLKNTSGQAFASSSNTLKVRPYRIQSS